MRASVRVVLAVGMRSPPLPLGPPPPRTGELGLDFCQTRRYTSHHACEEVCETGGGLAGRNPCARSLARRVCGGGGNAFTHARRLQR